MFADGSTSSMFSIEDGISEEKNILEDIRCVYESGMVNDIIIKCSDGIKLASNKSILAIRVPFFAKMFFGSFRNTIQDEVDLKSCESQTLNHILDFIWKGSLDLKSLSLCTLLNILETSRMLCLDSLFSGVERHLILRIDNGNVEVCDYLDALDFAVSNKFDSLLQSLLVHVDQNLQKVVDSTRFFSLSEASMLALLETDFQNNTADFVFEAFLKWVKNKEVGADIKLKMLDSFDLYKFSSIFLLKTVQKTEFFKDKDIFTVLINNVTKDEEVRQNLTNVIKEKEKIIRGKDRLLKSFCVETGPVIK